MFSSPSASRNHVRLGLIAAIIASAALSGCGRPSGSGDAGAATQGHPLTGVIVSASAERGTLLVQHDDIPGVMPPMTMEFHAPAGDVANARPGQRIRATMVQTADGYGLERIWPEDAARDRIVTEAARVLRQDTVTRGTAAFREVGEHLPDFALYDQDGEVVTPARFRGRQIMLNFIFSRCPDAKMCPAATARMISLQQQARAAGIQDLEFISVTLDPEFDTPGVLHDYAQARGIDTGNFSFLTGPEGAIKDLLTQLGILTFQDGPLITHTLATVLIDTSGKIVHRVDGSTWAVDDFLSRMHRTGPLEKPNP